MEKYNLIVAGGGLSGVAAAVSAARAGLKVLLVEKSGCLGGAISNNLVFPFMSYWIGTPGEENHKYITGGIFKEMRKREEQYVEDYSDRNFKSEYFKILLDDMVTEAGVNVIFHSIVFDVATEKAEVKSIYVTTPSGVMSFSADFFIDATGNGDLFAMAGCDYQLGRDEDGFCQPMTTCFRVCGVDLEKFNEEKAMLQDKYKEAQEKGEITNPREDILFFMGVGEGVLHFNTTRIIKLNPTDTFDISKAEIESRRQIHEIMSFLKANSEAFRNSTLISIANEIGVRESRKLKGVHILTADELKESIYFDDTIALGNRNIDIHSPTGKGTYHYWFGSNYYKIPYRSLLTKEFNNLLVAGRCVSATHEAQAAIRIMPICTSLGEAAGTAAALAYNTGKNAHNIDTDALREKLLENGAILNA